MRRRDFLTLAGGAAVVWSGASRAQQLQKQRRIALVHGGAPAATLTETGGTFWVRRFHEELRALGLVEGKNLVIERFSAEGDTNRFASLAAEVAHRKPEVIISGGSPLSKALMEADPMIPVVGIMGDPVAGGLVSNLARPGANLTGVSIDGGPGIPAKRLQILKEAVPTALRIEFLVSSRIEEQRSTARVAHRILPEVNEAQLRRTFAEMAEQKVDALLMSENGSFVAMRVLLAELASQHRIPVIYAYREYAEAGGLLASNSCIRPGRASASPTRVSKTRLRPSTKPSFASSGRMMSRLAVSETGEFEMCPSR
jgi:putative tryptophan/tyrosine transport system substrate-binding protein